QIGAGGKWKDVAAPHGPDTEPIRRLRQRAKFLTARNLWDAWGKVTATVVGMLMNWMVPLLVLVVIAALTVQFQGLEHGWMFWRWPATIGISLSIIAGIAYFGLLRAGSVWANRSGWCLLCRLHWVFWRLEPGVLVGFMPPCFLAAVTNQRYLERLRT